MAQNSDSITSTTFDNNTIYSIADIDGATLTTVSNNSVIYGTIGIEQLSQQNGIYISKEFYQTEINGVPYTDLANAYEVLEMMQQDSALADVVQQYKTILTMQR